MGSKRWRLSNRKKPAGQLGSADRFLPTAGEFAACSVSVPIRMDTKAAAMAAGGLASRNVRSFEIWWDGDEKRLDIVLAAEKRDLPAYRQAFSNMYPNAGFSDMDSAVPSWFPPGPECQIFDVGTYHGHYASMLDKGREHQLMSQIASTVQLSEKAWIQFVFMLYPFNEVLRRHVTRLNAKNREISRGKYLSNTEILMHPDKKPHDHPELGYDYTNNYAGLQKHATLKMQGAQVLLSARGVVCGGDGVDLPFDEIEAMPVENIHSGHEHLTKFGYEYADFAGEKKKRA